MRLFHLTFATIFRRKAWILCLLAVAALPFALPLLSTADENPVLVQPARAQAAWGALWVVALIWGIFTAARQGESNARSGVGEYFLTTGVSPTRQLLEIWLAQLCYIVPLALIAGIVCIAGASPSQADEKSMWLVTNFQYLVVFLLVVSPLYLLGAALASRFGGIAAFALTLGLAYYGLDGVGRLENMLKLEENPMLQSLWLVSPHYHLADLTPRLEFKLGVIPWDRFGQLFLYFSGIALVLAALSRAAFRIKTSA